MADYSPRSQPLPCLVSGLVASILMLALIVVFRLAYDIASLPELLADWFTLVLPLSIFSLIIGALEGSAKVLLMIAIAAAQLVFGMVLGMAHCYLWGTNGRLRAGGRAYGNQWAGGLIVALLLWLLTILVVMPAAGAGFLGLSSRAGPLSMTLTTLVESLSFGLSLMALHKRLEAWVAQPSDGLPAVDLQRRTLLLKLAAVPFALLAVAGAWQLLSRVVQSLSATGETPRAGYPDEITPTDIFYLVSKNFVDPVVDVKDWSLEVKGLVTNPLVLTYDDLNSFPKVDQVHTLICISNVVGGDLIGNATWTGVRLRDILARAGARQAVDVVLRARDGYSESIPLEKALEVGTVLAYEMNGESLQAKHGYPVRLLVPGIYGMKNVKWLTGIELVNSDYYGYWQYQGWTDISTIKTMSRIDVPPYGAVLPLAPVFLAGISFAGDRGISRVEVSADGGTTWMPMNVRPALSPYAWVLWTGTWQPPGPGSYVLRVRAWDKEGSLQDPVRVDPPPYGASGYHLLPVTVG